MSDLATLNGCEEVVETLSIVISGVSNAVFFKGIRSNEIQSSPSISKSLGLVTDDEEVRIYQLINEGVFIL